MICVELAKQISGLLHLQMGKIPIVAVSTAEIAREILQVSDLFEFKLLLYFLFLQHNILMIHLKHLSGF